MTRLATLVWSDGGPAEGAATGRLHIDPLVTLDGVAQAPGGPEDDPSGDFPFGGWQAPLDDDVVGREVTASIARMDAPVLGRRTYDIFAGYWPRYDENPIGRQLNGVPKYVASRGAPDLAWSGSTQLWPDLAAELRAVRAAAGPPRPAGDGADPGAGVRGERR